MFTVTWLPFLVGLLNQPASSALCQCAATSQPISSNDGGTTSLCNAIYLTALELFAVAAPRLDGLVAVFALEVAVCCFDFGAVTCVVR
jgi:hypothetical protein